MATLEDALISLKNAVSVIIIPGYGMEAPHPQHAVRDLGDLLEQIGVMVKYAIHPVTGRMPGHMNVLLAETNVAYDYLFDIDAINDEFPATDVALVVGTNDVVNPAAKHDPQSQSMVSPCLMPSWRARCWCSSAVWVPALRRSKTSCFFGPTL